MLAKTTPCGDSCIQIINPHDIFHPINIHALETYPDMIDAMNEYLHKIETLIESGEEIKTNDTIKYQLHWIISHYDASLEVPLSLVFDTLCHNINEGEFPANVFDDLSELERPTKSCEILLDINRRLLLYSYDYITEEEMHQWVDLLFEEGDVEQVYCIKE